MTASQYDVVVAGGGPGGATLAARLAQSGARVAIFEKEIFPRFHLGESLLPMSLEIFDKLGVTSQFHDRFIRKNGAWFVDGRNGDEVVFKFREALRQGFPHAFHGPRGEIDDVLLKHAQSLGVEVYEGWDVRGPIEEDDGRVRGIRVRSPEGRDVDVAAMVTVDATGRSALMSRPGEAKVKTKGLERTLALFAHFDGCHRMQGDDEGDIRIVIVPEGWFWVIPFRGNRSSVGIVLRRAALAKVAANLDDALNGVIEESPVMRDIMRGSTKVFPVSAAADYSYRVPRSSGDGWLAVGDAAGFIDPLFSTGFHLAVKGADLAAPAIEKALAEGDVSAERWRAHERITRHACETYIGVVQAFYRGDLIELLFQTKKRDMLRKMITSVLAGDVFHDEDPRWLREIERRFPADLGAGEGAGAGA
ncbi:MAG TPA: tryptophan 7-halogenase [Polyangiaceae bacterium]